MFLYFFFFFFEEYMCYCLFFFFQAEDGIRDLTVTGVQTCALPIFVRLDRDGRRSLDLLRWGLVPWWAKDIKIGARCINAMRRSRRSPPSVMPSPAGSVA